jgi:hypothetical protein
MMRYLSPSIRTPLPFFAAMLTFAAACNVVLEEDIFSPNPDSYNGGSQLGSGGEAGTGVGGGSTTSSGSGGAGDIPCDVADVLAAHCDQCHAANIPPMLRSRADFMAPSTSDPSKSMAEVSLERMQDGQNPMPPDGVPPSADVQIFADWVGAGVPAGDCGGGTGGAGGSPYDTPVTCTSGQTWNNGDEGTSRMYPGRACNDCHASEKPDEIYSFAGTVYPTAHEPDDCLGVGSGDAVVEITDDNGNVHTATTNSSGNFSSNAGIAFPATVRIVVGNQSLEMVTPLMAGDGDCNTCHTQDGSDGAPGRIILPF